MRRQRLILLMTLCLVLNSADGTAGVSNIPDDESLIRAADAVVIADVTSVRTLAGPRDIERHVQLRVVDSLKGAAPAGEIITLIEPGGILGSVAEIIPGSAEYESGQRVLVCATLLSSGQWRTLGMAQGRFQRSRHGERAGWVRDLFGGPAAAEPRHRWREESLFTEYARSIAAGVDAEGSYWRERPATLGPLATSNTTLHPPEAYLTYAPGTTTPVRWNGFAAPARWYSNGTHAGAAGGGMTALNKALAAWTDEPNSDVVLDYAGFTPELRGICAGCEDGFNTIHLGDPNNELPFNADSLTKIWVDLSTTHTFKGTIFATIRSADIVVGNRRYDETELEELLTREFGLALGFRDANVPGRSPSSDTAVMTLTDGGYGRYGAVLQAWDREALFAVYPSQGFVLDPLQPAKAEAMIAGDPVSFTFTVTGSYGGTAPITFRLKEPLPSGVSVAFSPNSAPATGSTTVTMSLRATAGVAPADLAFTVVAESGGIRREAPAEVAMFDYRVSEPTDTLYPGEKRTFALDVVWLPRPPSTLQVTCAAEAIAIPGVQLSASCTAGPRLWITWHASSEAGVATVAGKARITGSGRTAFVPLTLRITEAAVEVDHPLKTAGAGASVSFAVTPVFANGSEGERVVFVGAQGTKCGFSVSTDGDRLRIENRSALPGVYHYRLFAELESPRRKISRYAEIAVVVPPASATVRYRVYRGPDYDYSRSHGAVTGPRDVNGSGVVLTEGGIWRPLSRSGSVYHRGAWIPEGPESFEAFKWTEAPYPDMDERADMYDIDDLGNVAGRVRGTPVVTHLSKALLGVYEYRDSSEYGVYYRLSGSRAVGASYSNTSRSDSVATAVYAGDVSSRMSTLVEISDKRGSALSINKHGLAVGWYKPDGTTKRPFTYQNGKLSQVATIAGSAIDVSDAGSILLVGEDGKSWLSKGGHLSSLPLEQPAVDMNNSEVVIGGASVFEAGSTIDLNSSIPGVRNFYIRAGVALNERGDILATGAYVDDQSRCSEQTFSVLLVNELAPAKPQCTYESQLVGDIVSVSTQPHCRWVADTASSWVSLTNHAQVGSGTIQIKPASNTLPFERYALISVEGQVLKYVQPAAAPACTAPLISAQPQPLTLTIGESGSLAVDVLSTTPPSFEWMVNAPGTTAVQVVPNASAATLTVKPDRAGTWVYWVRVTNACGSVESARVNVEVHEPVPACKPPAAGTLFITFDGPISRCSASNAIACTPGEPIRFTASIFGSGIQTCDSLAWDFGDGSSVSSGREVTHSYNSPGSYSVRLTLTNNHGVITAAAPVQVGSVMQPPQAPAFSWSPNPIVAGQPVQLTGTATGTVDRWQWNFESGATAHGQSVSHTFSTSGTHWVSLVVSNAAGSVTATRGLTVTSPSGLTTYLIPAVAQAPGAGNSAWKSDLHVAAASATPGLTAELEFNGLTKSVPIAGTAMIFENVVSLLTSGVASGPMLVRVSSSAAVAIWSRTYNATAGQGTFGQLIPAIRLDNQAGSQQVVLPGIESSESFRTNLGFANPTANEVTVDVVARHADGGATPAVAFRVTVPPYQLHQVTNLSARLGGKTGRFTFHVTAAGSGRIVAYASSVDNRSGDPVYLDGVPMFGVHPPSLSSTVLAGVGRIGSWRSDVVLWNAADSRQSVDLEFINGAGQVAASARGIALQGGETRALQDFLGWIGSGEDAIGMLRVTSTAEALRYPIVYGRTYNQQGERGTFGQGIPSQASVTLAARAGSPVFVPAIRSDARFYTNLGLVAGEGPVTARVTLLDPRTGVPIGDVDFQLGPSQSLVVPNILTRFATPVTEGTLRVSVVSGTGLRFVFGSMVDTTTKDPEYVPAVTIP